MIFQLKESDVARLESLLGDLLEKEEIEKATVVAGLLADENCTDPDRWLLLAHHAMKIEDWDLAELRLRKALECGGRSPQLSYEMSKVLEKLGRDSQAVSWAEKTIEAAPRNPSGYFRLAGIHVAKERIAEAEAVLRKVLDSKSFSGEIKQAARKSLADTLMNARRFAEAVPHFRKALQMEGDNAGLWRDLGHCLSRKGDLDGALEAFQKSVELNPSAGNFYVFGDCLLGLGRNSEAIAVLKKAVALDPNHVMANYDLGLAYYKEKRYKEGAVASFRALGDDPEMEYQLTNPGVGATLNRGLCLLEQGFYEEAMACFDKNINKMVPSMFNKGLTYFRMNRPKDAIIWFNKVLEIDPKDAASLNLMAQALDEAGKFPEAVAALRKALKIDPGYALGFYDLGIILGRKKGNEVEAMRCFNKALELGVKEPFPAQAQYSIACLHALAGRKKAALSVLEKALKMGYDDRKHIGEDKDWDRLRRDPEFTGLLRKYFGD